MSDIRALLMTTLWLTALYLLLTNATGATNILKGAGDTWFAGVRVLQGR